MPIRVTCPGCAAGITAPDAAAGRTLKCPKCKGPLTVPEPEPAFEAVEDDELVPLEVVDDAPPAPAGESPKKKKKKKKPVASDKSPGQKAGLIVGGVFAGLLALVGIWALFIRAGAPPDPNMGADGWYTLVPSDESFTMQVPGGPPERGGFNPGKIATVLGRASGAEEHTARIAIYTRASGGREFVATHAVFDRSMRPSTSTHDTMLDIARGGKEVESEGPVTANGVPGRTFVARNAERTVIAAHFDYSAGGNANLLTFVVRGDASLDPQSADVKRFFERAKPNPSGAAGRAAPPAAPPPPEDDTPTRASASELTQELFDRATGPDKPVAEVLAVLGHPVSKNSGMEVDAAGRTQRRVSMCWEGEGGKPAAYAVFFDGRSKEFRFLPDGEAGNNRSRKRDLNEKNIKQMLAAGRNELDFLEAFGNPKTNTSRLGKAPDGGQQIEGVMTWLKEDAGPSARAVFREGLPIKADFYPGLPPAE